MASKTSYLGLILPSFGEFYNSWYKPNNSNFVAIDSFANSFGTEVTDARGTTTNLNERLSVVLNPDGSIKAIPEIEEAKSSSIYGYGTGTAIQSLDARIELGDLETFTARQGYAGLIDLLAWMNAGNKNDCLVSGPTNPLTFSGAIVTLNGGTTPVVSNINGYRAVTSVQDDVTLTGPDATYYLKLNRNATGKVFFTIPTFGGAVGTVGINPVYSKFSVPSANLISAGVKPGHILEITAPAGSLNLGKWVVYQTNTENPSDLTANDIAIVGSFPSAGSGFDARFIYPQAPTLVFTATPPPASFTPTSGAAYIGQATLTSGNVTSVIPFAYQAAFSGWQQVTPVAGDFSYTISHNLGFVPKEVHIYGSQADDFSQPLELLSVAKMTGGSASLTSGDQTITYTSPVLRRSVIVNMTSTVLNIKNATNSVFYEDFSGSVQTAGYLYIVVER